MKWTNKEQIGGAHWVYDVDTESWVASVATEHVALITAAPELLAACQAAIKQTNDKTIRAFGLGPEMTSVLIAAVAKAVYS